MSDALTDTEPKPAEDPQPRQLSVAEQMVETARARLAVIDRQIKGHEDARDGAVAAIKELKAERVQVEKVANSLNPRASRSKG